MTEPKNPPEPAKMRVKVPQISSSWTLIFIALALFAIGVLLYSFFLDARLKTRLGNKALEPLNSTQRSTQPTTQPEKDPHRYLFEQNPVITPFDQPTQIDSVLKANAESKGYKTSPFRGKWLPENSNTDYWTFKLPISGLLEQRIELEPLKNGVLLKGTITRQGTGVMPFLFYLKIPAEAYPEHVELIQEEQTLLIQVKKP